MIEKQYNLMVIDYDLVKNLSPYAVALFVHMEGLDIDELDAVAVSTIFPELTLEQYASIEIELNQVYSGGGK